MLDALLFACILLGSVQAGDDPRQGYNTADDSQFQGNEDDFFKFISRPDIQAPRWQANIHELDEVAPGYWFVAPYEHTFRPAPLPAWVGPHIYDGSGELVWSGASMFQQSDSYDFRKSRFGDEDLMTFEYRDARAAVLMDSNFKVREEDRFAKNLGDLNMHDLNIIEGGNRALVLTKQPGVATEQMSKDIGLERGECHVGFDGFKLMDTTTDDWQPVFEWSTFDHIPLTESTFVDKELENRCEHGWDYLHLNSVDICPDSHYLLSSRHADTIYKINSTDGSIMWRLGGQHSDFKQDFEFSRQHDIRCREQEHDLYTISFLDNAKGSDSQNATNDYSRGLIVEVDAATRTATIRHEYAHPQRDYSTSRGNLEILDNGNIFMGWAKQCLQSEYTAAGKLLMEAKLVPEFLSTYRAYKYPFKGEPTRPPDVHSEVVEHRSGDSPAGGDGLATHVYVSWNGATEVEEWRLYRSDSSAQHKELIATARRSGFETFIAYEGYVSYVVVEAIDSWGHEMKDGRSGVVMTVHPAEWASEEKVATIDTASEETGQQGDEQIDEPVDQQAEAQTSAQAEAVEQNPRPSASLSPAITFLAGCLSMALLLALAYSLSRTLKGNNTIPTLISRLRSGKDRGEVNYLPLAESEKDAEARDPGRHDPRAQDPRGQEEGWRTREEVLRTRQRSESKATSVHVQPLNLGLGKGMHKRGDSIQRWGRERVLTP